MGQSWITCDCTRLQIISRFEYIYFLALLGVLYSTVTNISGSHSLRFELRYLVISLTLNFAIGRIFAMGRVSVASNIGAE